MGGEGMYFSKGSADGDDSVLYYYMGKRPGVLSGFALAA
jgi:hypothetical protein